MKLKLKQVFSRDFIKEHWGDILIGSAVVLEILLLFYYSIFHLQDSFDHDFAKVIRHVIEMGDHHTLFLKDFDYMSQGEMDESSLIALPIYMLTGNVYLGYTLAGIINTLLYAWVLWRLMDFMKLKAAYRLSAMGMIFTAYEFGMLEYTNMLFFAAGYYIYKVLAPLLLLIILCSDFNDKWKVSDIIFSVLYGLLVIFTGLASGTYVLVCGMLPIFVCLAVCMICGVAKKRYLRWGLLMAGSSIVTVVCMKIGHHFGIYAYSYNVKSIDDIIPDHLNTLVEVLKVFHSLFAPYGRTPFDIEGIAGMLRFLIAIIVLLFGMLSIGRFFCLRMYNKVITGHKEEMEGEYASELISSSLFSIFLWNFILISLLTYSAPRYHIIGVIPLMICACANVQDLLKDDKVTILPKLAPALLALFLIYVNLFSCYDGLRGYFHYEDHNQDKITAIIGYMDENDIDTVFTINDTDFAEKIRMRALDKVTETYETENGTIHNHIYYHSELDRSAFTARNLIVASEENFNLCPGYVKDNYEKTAQFEDLNFYVSDNCPFDGLTGFPFWDHSIDLPTAPYTQTVLGELDGRGYLTADADEVVLLSAPIENEGKDRFRMVFHYELKDAEASLDLYSGTDILTSYELDPDKDTLEIDFPVEAGTYAYAVRKTGGDRIIIKETEFFKVK